jgi:hypothetical protein
MNDQHLTRDHQSKITRSLRHNNNKNVEAQASENNSYCRRYIYLNVDNDHVELNVVTKQLLLDGVIQRPVLSSPVDVFP